MKRAAADTAAVVAEVLENNRMGDFLNGIGVVGALCNRKSAMITDGMNLYVFDSETV